MRLGFGMGWAIAALVGLPVVACVGAPFSSAGGTGGASSSTAATGRTSSVATGTSTGTTSTGGGGTGGGTGGAGGMGSVAVQATSTGTGPTCTPPLMMCANQCANLDSDPDNCGKCGNKCAGGEVCKSGACGCPPGGIMCNGACVNGAFDPTNCGSCGNLCDHEQACAGSTCGCRPPLKAMSGGCYDIKHDPMHCGATDQACVSGDVCGSTNTLSGCMTTTECGLAGGTACGDGGCYTKADFATNPFNCGGCKTVCAPTQLCVQGQCRDYTVPLSCGPSSCSGGMSCCSFPGIANDIVCLDNSTCG